MCALKINNSVLAPICDGSPTIVVFTGDIFIWVRLFSKDGTLIKSKNQKLLRRQKYVRAASPKEKAEGSYVSL